MAVSIDVLGVRAAEGKQPETLSPLLESRKANASGRLVYDSTSKNAA